MLHKVQPGDPILASQWNELLEVLGREKPGVLGLAPGLTELPCTVYAQNDSGENAPMYTPCSITGRTIATADHLKFTKPDAPPYGILLEPAAPGKMALVAVDGGVYLLTVNDAEAPEVGGTLAPVKDEWTATAGDSDLERPWRAYSDVREGRCLTTFFNRPPIEGEGEITHVWEMSGDSYYFSMCRDEDLKTDMTELFLEYAAAKWHGGGSTSMNKWLLFRFKEPVSQGVYPRGAVWVLPWQFEWHYGSAAWDVGGAGLVPWVTANMNCTVWLGPIDPEDPFAGPGGSISAWRTEKGIWAAGQSKISRSYASYGHTKPKHHRTGLFTIEVADLQERPAYGLAVHLDPDAMYTEPHTVGFDTRGRLVRPETVTTMKFCVLDSPFH